MKRIQVEKRAHRTITTFEFKQRLVNIFYLFSFLCYFNCLLLWIVALLFSDDVDLTIREQKRSSIRRNFGINLVNCALLTDNFQWMNTKFMLYIGFCVVVWCERLDVRAKRWRAQWISIYLYGNGYNQTGIMRIGFFLLCSLAAVLPSLLLFIPPHLSTYIQFPFSHSFTFLRNE